jgi:DNA-binding NarL/FixJ family response regulator
MNPLHLLLIDDHAMFRTGLRMVLNDSMSQVRVAEAGSLEEALQTIQEVPHLVLLDIKLPGLNGVEGIGLLKRKWPTAQILMLSSQDEPETMRLAMERGATGFVSKADTAEKIVTVIALVLNGQPCSAAERPPASGAEAAAPQTLTPRQCEVLSLLCQGLSNKLIARRLQLSEHTVRGHVQGILRFLQVSSRSEATFAARQRGLVA